MSDVHARVGRPRSIFTDEVMESIPLWLELGANRRDIAAILGTTVGSLDYACQREGISLRMSSQGIRRALGPARWAKLRGEAEQRGVSVSQLLVSVIATIVDDGLFNAVFDDGSGEQLG